ncbi:AAA family ATPase [bacterium]|nr:AAA family ATPase [bacterium]
MPDQAGIAQLLSDLDTIAGIAGTGVLSREELRLEEGETRPAAVLFVDVVGFSELAQRLGTEQLAVLVDRSFRIFELSVKAQGGYCDKVIGDAGLYVFAGHPNYPPICEAALCAGLSLLDRAAQVSASLASAGLRLDIRAGVSFGAVTRRRAGSAEASESVYGETVNLSQRLQSAAQPGQLLSTPEVLERAGDSFSVEDLGQHELKGSGSQRLLRVLAQRPRQSRLRGAFSQLSPLTGRSELLARCREQLAQWDHHADTAPVRLLILRGSAAVGKSRLAYELARTLQKERAAPEAASPLLLASAHCTAQGTISEFCAELCALAGLDSTNLLQRWEELCALALEQEGSAQAAILRGHLPLLASLLGNSEVDSSALRQAGVQSFELGCRLALKAALELSSASGGQAVLLLEDLQWLGERAELLRAVLGGLRTQQPLLVLATARPEYQHQPGSLGETATALIEVRPLDSSAGRELLAALLPGLVLPPDVDRELHDKAAGLPYYYEEFARMLLRRGIAAPVDSAAAEPRYQLVAEIRELALPENVQALILGRLDQLPRDLKELAMRASVLGRSFRGELLAELEQRLARQHKVPLEERLEALASEHILQREAEGSAEGSHGLG